MIFEKAGIVSLQVLLLVFCHYVSEAQLRLDPIFGDHMVIQRNHPIKIWGSASPYENVSIDFDGDIIVTKSNEMGLWEIALEERTTGGSHLMQVFSSGDTISISDILIGDIWLCSGQSNMELMVQNSYSLDQEIVDTDDPQIRHFKVPKSTALSPERQLVGGEWKVNARNNTGEFTAVGFFFAKELRKHTDVPVGLINATWGGSRIESWMSANCPGNENFDQDVVRIKRESENKFKDQLQDLRKVFPDISTVDQGTVVGIPVWAAPDLDDSDWVDIEVPSTWEYMFDGLDGIGWYRTNIELTQEEARNGIELGLGQIDDSDDSYVNGVRVGGIFGAYNAERVYQVNPEVLRTGRNNITIRVEDGGGGGGMAGKPSMLYVKTNKRTVPLARSWKYKIGAYSNQTFAANKLPTLLYNKMIHPLHSLPVKGILWYQGESNANSTQEALAYGGLFTTMIKDWREQWDQGELPFLYVQLPNYKETQSQPEASIWATLRNAQTAALDLPNVGQAVTIDLGEKDDIHPKNKHDVGKRLSLVARKIVYDEDIVSSGPTYKKHQIIGNQIVIYFDNIGSGLISKGNEDGWLSEFSIAGSGGLYEWAKARIEGDKVIIWNDHVNKPTQVRYAWTDNPEKANFYNEEGLPASPFWISE